MADLALALANLERAFSELESYPALPIAHARDKAGLIQGFAARSSGYDRARSRPDADAHSGSTIR